MSDERFAFLCWGDVGLDLYEDEKSPRPGGCALNVAVSLAMSDPPGSVACAGPIGPDGEHLIQVVEGAGVDASLLELRDGATPRQPVRLAADGERTLSNYAAGVLTDYEPSPKVLAAVDRAEMVYVPLFSATRQLAELALERRAGLRPVALDLMDLTEVDVELIERAVHRASVVFCGLDAQRDKATITELTRLSADPGSALVVVTLGAAGARAFAAGREERVPALPVPGGVVDTTGCGDAFAGAFLAARSRHLTLRAALEMGARRAAEVAAHRGAVRCQTEAS